MKKLALAATLGVVLAACTPQEVLQWMEATGTPLTPEQVDLVVVHTTKYTSTSERGCDANCAIRQAFGVDADWALNVAWCESSMNPAARNGQHVGLFQIATRVHSKRIARHGYTAADMAKVGPNVEIAHELFAEQGRTPWAASRACWA